MGYFSWSSGIERTPMDDHNSFKDIDGNPLVVGTYVQLVDAARMVPAAARAIDGAQRLQEPVDEPRG